MTSSSKNIYIQFERNTVYTGSTEAIEVPSSALFIVIVDTDLLHSFI